MILEKNINITTVLLDLDGTLLPMDQDVFVKDCFGRLATNPLFPSVATENRIC